MKRINHEARPGGPTMAAVSVTRLTQHAPVFRLEPLLFNCSPTAPGTSPVGGFRSFANTRANGKVAPILAVRPMLSLGSRATVEATPRTSRKSRSSLHRSPACHVRPARSAKSGGTRSTLILGEPLCYLKGGKHYFLGNCWYRPKHRRSCRLEKRYL
jgi:hypothetical protein